MAQKFPKFLCEFTIVAGVNDHIEFWCGDIDNPPGAPIEGAWVDAIVPPGDYFMSHDGQTDDFCVALSDAMNAAAVAAGSALKHRVVVGDATDVPMPGCRAGQVCIWQFNNTDIMIDWDDDAAAIQLSYILGARSQNDIGFYFSGTDGYARYSRQHAYGWYANTDYCVIEMGQDPSDYLETIGQSISMDGTPFNQRYGGHRERRITLGWVTAEKTFSNGAGYTEIPYYPYDVDDVNLSLECLWREIRQGIPFRFYPDYRGAAIYSGLAADAATCTTTTIDYAAGTWKEDECRRLIVNIDDRDNAGVTIQPTGERAVITDTAATSLTWAAADAMTADPDSATFSIYDRQYVELQLMPDSSTFAPERITPNAFLYRWSFKAIEVP